MDSGQLYTVTLDEFKAFHRIDRALYTILVRDIGRNPLECLYVMGLWLWLERVGGFYNFISKVLSLPLPLIDDIAEEAILCLKFTNIRFSYLSQATEIPLTFNIAKKDISLQFFYDRRFTAFGEIENLINTVCIPVFSDIIEIVGYHPGFIQNPMPRSAGTVALPSPSDQTFARPMVQSISSLRLVPGVANASHPPNRPPPNEILQNEKTMFLTFSKGYPVSENEVRVFFTRLFGNCIESLNMQEVKSDDEQALYAKIVFINPSFIRSILNGLTKARYTINGKHVWVRRFASKNNIA